MAKNKLIPRRGFIHIKYDPGQEMEVVDSSGEAKPVGTPNTFGTVIHTGGCEWLKEGHTVFFEDWALVNTKIDGLEEFFVEENGVIAHRN